MDPEDGRSGDSGSEQCYQGSKGGLEEKSGKAEEKQRSDYVRNFV